MMQVDVRRTLVDFERCFACGSIAGGSLRNEDSRGHCASLFNALEKFSSCTRTVHDEELGDVCVQCEADILQKGKEFEELMPSASGLCCAISDAVYLVYYSNLVTLGGRLSRMLRRDTK